MPNSNSLSTVQNVQIKSFDEYLKIIDTFNAFSSTDNYVLLLRGQKEDKWDLIPGLARPKLIRSDIEKIEKNIITEFKRRSVPLLPKTFNSNSEWEWLALAQHYKLPTRLLDWTENPLVALFFAFEFEKENNNDRAVWAFTTNEDELVNTVDLTLNPYTQTKTKVYIPNQVTQRITVQSGWFTVHKYMREKNKFIPLNLNSTYVSRIRKLSLPNDIRNNVLLTLDRLGINSYSIYPDLEGLSNFLTWKYFK